MAIVLVIILIVIGMITQGSDKEKGCGWTIVACVTFLLLLSQLGISGENAANLFLWVIGIGTISLIIWGISQSKKNNNSNPTKHVDNMIQLEQNKKCNEIILQDITEQSISEENKLECMKDNNEVIKNDKQDEELLIFKEVIKKKENLNEKFESGDAYQRLVVCINNYIQIKNSGDEKSNTIGIIEKEESLKGKYVFCDLGDEKSNTVGITKLTEMSNEKLYDQNIKSMVNEFQKCTSIDDIIKTYIDNRSKNDILNPANLGLLRGYLVRNTSYKDKKYLSSTDLRMMVREKSYNCNIEQFSISEKIKEKGPNPLNELSTNFCFEVVVNHKEDDLASVYSPIKIQIEDKELLEPYKTFDKMRKIGNQDGYNYYKRDVEVFVKQANFMKDFQDNYNTVVSFQDYAPTYMLMSDLQLRTYFTWRTKFRNGECIDCSPSYLYLYINEIINNVGVKNNQEAIKQLFGLWHIYQGIDYQFKRNMTTWIKDYYVLNDFKQDFKTVIATYKNMGLFEEVYDSEMNQSVFGYYDRISNYKIKESKFYSSDKLDDICSCFDMVIIKLLDYFNQLGVDFDNIINDKKTLVETSWRPFSGALYNIRKLRKEKTVYISDNEYYKYENGTWISFKPDTNNFVGAEIVGYIIKRMEAKMRNVTGFKFKLSPKRSTLISHLRFQLQYFNKKLDLKFLEEEDLDRIIDNCVEEYYEEKQNKQYSLECTMIKKECNEEDKELTDIRIIPKNAEIDLLFEGEKIGIQEKSVDDLQYEIPQIEKIHNDKNRFENLHDCKYYDFKQNVHEYINNLESLKKDKIVYDEPNTNITRFKKSEKEYAEKLIIISQLETNLDENSHQFSRFINDKFSSDLRAINFLCTGYSDYTKGYVVWMKLIDCGKLYFPVSSTYINVLMYQIINRLIVKSPCWALIILIDLWNHYYPDFQHKETLMWIKDFWVTYCSDITYLEFKKLFKYEIEFQGDNRMDAIDSIDVSYLSKNKFLDFFNENSNYKIKTGRTVQEGHEIILDLCLGETIRRLQFLFKEHELKLDDYFNLFDEEEIEKIRDPFRRSILINQTKNYITSNVSDRIVGDYEKYNVVTDGEEIKFLIRRKRYTYFKSRLFIENIGKICELFLRDWLGIPAKFIVNMEELCGIIPGLNSFENNGENEIFRTIKESVETICNENKIMQSEESKTDINHLRNNKPQATKTDDTKKFEKQQFNIDVSKLDKIRSDAELIQKKLIVEDEVAFKAEEIDVIQEREESQVIKQSSRLQNNEDDEWQELVKKLSSYELQTLSIILNQTDVKPKLEELSKKSGTLIEVMIEEINEKALEVIGDNLIEASEDVPIIYQDYVLDIGRYLQEEK